MAKFSKRFKLKFTLPSFQFCRSNKQPILPAITFFSPVNPKSSDISYPTFPDPPPSTPTHLSKFISLNSHKIHNSPTSSDSDNKSPIQHLKSKSTKDKKNRNKCKSKSKSKSKVCASISSGDGVWFSSEDEDEDETKSIFSSSRSFDSSLETIKECPNYEDKKNNKKSAKLRVRRLRRYVSYSCKTASSDSESDLAMKKPSRKMKESFAIVKQSKEPYEEFKRSMLEMILEKQIFEANDLEQLLQCFLSLNSKQYHAVIVQAFSEIWTDLFV